MTNIENGVRHLTNWANEEVDVLSYIKTTHVTTWSCVTDGQVTPDYYHQHFLPVSHQPDYGST